MKPLSIEWQGDLKFRNTPDSPAIELHSATPGVTSPPEALAYAVMACMAMDVAHVITKGRHLLERMVVTFNGERAPEPPRRFTSMSLHFELASTVAPHIVDRAIELSRTKYCSVWHTIRPDVALTTSFLIQPIGSAP